MWWFFSNYNHNYYDHFDILRKVIFCISSINRNDVVPVAMGAHPDDYARSAPPNSFIHVEDFESPQHLARYLKVLDKNDELYNDYFRWKGTGDFIDTKFWCRLCAMLNDLNKPELIIRDIAAWWRQPEVCIRGDQRWRRWCFLNLNLFVQFSPLQLKIVCLFYESYNHCVHDGW